MSVKLLIDPVQFLRMARGLNDIELGASMRALVESALDDGNPKNIKAASYFGSKTNGFFHIDEKTCISAANCNYAVAIREA